MNTVDMVTVHSVASAMLVGLHRHKNTTISHFLAKAQHNVPPCTVQY